MANTPDLVVIDVTKHFAASSTKTVSVLRGMTWSAHAGTITGLVGPNGCGKTTMMNVLAGNLQPDSGTLTFPKWETSSLSRMPACDQARHLCAWMPEHPGLPSWLSGKDVIKEYAMHDAVTPADQRHRLQEFSKMFPVEDFWDRPCKGYSRGQAFLIALGRLSIIDRPIMLLDEPTIGLDFENAQRVRQWLRYQAHQQGKTVIMATHVLRDVQAMADTLIGFDNGRVASKETVASWLSAWSEQPHPSGTLS